MHRFKRPFQQYGPADSIVTPATAIVPEHQRGTAADVAAMAAMNRPQVFRRYFNLLGMCSILSSVMVTWPMFWNVSYWPMTDGGRPAMFAALLWSPLVWLPTYWSLAELAAMRPTASGQFHWVSEFAPPRCQRFCSYMIGWQTALGWQAYVAVVCNAAAAVLLGLIQLHTGITLERGYVTAGTIVVAIGGAAINIYGMKRLQIMEIVMCGLFVVGPFFVMIVSLVLGPIDTAENAFTDIANLGGWSSSFWPFCIGVAGVSALFTGYDCTIHMAEELEDSSKNMKRVFQIAFPVNWFLLLLMVITAMITMNDNSIFSTTTGQPFIQHFYNITGSKAMATVMTLFVSFPILFACVSEMAPASRQFWSFAQHGGIPGGKYIAKVDPVRLVPSRAIVATATITSLLSLIYIGSYVGLFALLAIGAISILSSYIESFMVMIWRRLQSEPLPAGANSKRKGMWLNGIAVAALIPTWIFNAFPLYQDVQILTMNWSVPLFAAVNVLAAFYYQVYGYKCYESPKERLLREHSDQLREKPKTENESFGADQSPIETVEIAKGDSIDNK